MQKQTIKQKLFNKKLDDVIKSGQISFRTCWKCNPSHKHLRTNSFYIFLGCDHWYYKGKNITIE